MFRFVGRKLNRVVGKNTVGTFTGAFAGSFYLLETDRTDNAHNNAVAFYAGGMIGGTVGFVAVNCMPPNLYACALTALYCYTGSQIS